MTERGALSPREVADFLGFDVSTVYRLQKEGVIPYVIVGCSRRTSRLALERMVDPDLPGPRTLPVDSQIHSGVGQS